MTLQPAFAVDGATYPGAQLRMMQRATSGGAQGIVSVGDLAVRALDVPGTSVRIGDGQALVIGRDGLDPGQVSGQGTYAIWNSGDEVVPVTGTGSAGTRSDLLILRVEDPTWPGSGWVHDPAADPMVYPYVIQGVPAGTTTIPPEYRWSAIPLARIDWPASTATVTQDMIVDVRSLAAPRITTEQRIQTGVTPYDLGGNITTYFENWPNLVWEDIVIPSWATQVQMVGTWAQVFYGAEDLASGSGSTDARGRLRVALGFGEGGGPTDLTTRFSSYNLNLDTSNAERHMMLAGDQLLIPAAMRGQAANLRLQCQGTEGVRGRLRADEYATFLGNVTFREVPTVDVS
jgi:hypothetical protein